MPIHSKLSTLLGEKRMNMSELARQTGISKVTIGGLYHDRVSMIKYSIISRICTVLECSIDDLLEFTPESEEAMEEYRCKEPKTDK